MKIENYKLKIIISAFVIFLLLSVVNSSDAAELFFNAKTQEFGIGQQFQVDLMLDTEGEIINALEGEIVFPEELLEIKEIRDGDSIINLWVERPLIKQTDKIVFSGIIPTGFEGVLSPHHEGYRPGKVFSLIFISKNEGQGTLVLENGRVLLHDGLGTPAPLKISNFRFLISKDVPISQTSILEIKDTDPPEEFLPEITRDPNMFGNKWFLVFLTQDKGAGIDHYEIQENRKQKIENRRWKMVESPHLLKDQKLRSFIYVKAVDRAGNERIVVVEPQYPVKWYENWLIWIIIILGVIILYIIGKILWKKSQNIGKA